MSTTTTFTTTDRHVICIGGGCLNNHKDKLYIEKHLITLTGKSRPKVCYIPTADGDNRDGILTFYECFSTLDCIPTHLPLFHRSERTDTTDIPTFLLAQDLIYVGGGNTLSMIALWKAWNVDSALRQCYDSGKILCGVSAGSNCWFKNCTTDSYPGQLRAVEGLGWLPYSHSPHYDKEETRRPTFHRLIKEGKLAADGYAADDGAAIHYVNEELHEVLTWREKSSVYHVTLEEGEIKEQKVETKVHKLDQDAESKKT